VQSSSQIITTNKPTSSFSYRPDAFLSPNQQCQSTEGKSTERIKICGLETLLLFFPAEIIHHTCILVAKRDVNMIHPLIDSDIGVDLVN